ncbi:MAG: TetR/AcrR family transcriptional regulator [Streptosporangiaceae bacterium]|nr:TetR/AcrR family transcriptional regulator [Streptosporangiaceae bacterium]MBV9857322.1 TetR/AcrR family transcriptional regulator [Streptosporangiaceae bacterium]
MGNREELLAAAKRCLIEKGYARTTARDIAAASGVSLAAIGYHFGSKDALMNQAVYESIGDWSEEVRHALAAEGTLGAEPLQRFESIMGRTIDSFGGSGRGLWAAQLELMSLLGHNDELRAFLAGVQHDAAMGLAELFLGIDPARDAESARMAGAVLHALFIGVLVKWFMDPKQALSAHELAEGVRIIAERMTGKNRTGA